MNNNFTFKNFYRFDDHLKQIWENLEKTGRCYFFQKYKYTYNYITTFQTSHFVFSVIYNDGEPFAIFPFEIKVFKKVRILQWLGSSHNDLNCPIILKQNLINEKNFTLLWSQILNDIKDIDIILLNKQPEYIEKISNPFVKYLSKSTKKIDANTS